MKVFPLFGVLVAGLVSACGSEPASAATASSGRYEQLALAVGRDGTVSGTYGEEQGQGAAKTCKFAIAGRIGAAGEGPITAWSGGRALRGRITARGDEVRLTVPGAKTFPGCGLVLMEMIDTGLPLSKVSSAGWTSMRAITAPRARLYTQPGGTTARGYVVRGDIVGVRGQQGGRLAVDYVSPAGRVSRCWVSAAETGALSPPQ